MKKGNIFIVILLVILNGFFFRQCHLLEEESIEIYCENLKRIYSINEDICYESLENIFIQKEYILLTIVTEECITCEQALARQIDTSLNIAPYFIQINKSKRCDLIMQALHTRGFPTFYIIDSEYNIVGIIRGNKNFEKKLNGFVNNKGILVEDSIKNINSENLLPLLSSSYKAALALIDNDFENVKTYATNSLKWGDFFFNNYALYKYYQYIQNSDSTYWYRAKCLKHTEGVNSFIYKTLITELTVKQYE